MKILTKEEYEAIGRKVNAIKEQHSAKLAEHKQKFFKEDTKEVENNE